MLKLSSCARSVSFDSIQIIKSSDQTVDAIGNVSVLMAEYLPEGLFVIAAVKLTSGVRFRRVIS